MTEQEIKGTPHFDKDPLMANYLTVDQRPDKFILDFAGIYPQFLPNSQPHLVMNHKSVLVDPHFVKTVIKVLQENVERFEKRFGEIKTPEAVKEAEKELKDNTKATASAPDKPSYMG